MKNLMKYWYINGQCLFSIDEKNPETSKVYTAGEILKNFSTIGINRLAIKFHPKTTSEDRK